MADDEQFEEEKVVIDYDEVDTETGFKVAEITIWRAFEENVLNKPEDERPDVDGWVDEFSEEKGYDRKRVKYVTTLGIYAGTRDEFNQRSGSGKAIYANGDIYEGEFFEGQKHGHGQYIFKSQGRAEVDVLIEKAWSSKPAEESQAAFITRVAGQLKVGEMVVKAALTYGFYPVYIGDYHLGVRTGRGEMKCRDGSYYRGGWQQNKRHGKGMLYFVNGDIYSGDWEAGQKHGSGAYRFANGSEFRGRWEKGTFGQGQWIYSEGSYFEGAFDRKNRPMDENGTMHFPSLKMSVQGTYKKGVWAPANDMVISEEKPEDEEWAE